MQARRGAGWVRLCGWAAPLGLVIALAGAGTAGCGGEEGLIVKVTRDPATPAALDSLSFLIARRQVSTTDTSRFAWVQDPDSSSEVPLDGRDLLDEPYSLFLHDGTGGAEPAEIMVAVIAKAGGTDVAFGAFGAPQRFEPGRVLRRDIQLVGYRANGDPPPFVVSPQGCLSWAPDPILPDQKVTLAIEGDKDCDGDPLPADCDDFDPRRGTNQPEACDGFDSSCHTKTPEPGRCYGYFPVCDFGQRPCVDDTVPGGRLGACEADPNEPSLSVPDEFCAAYAECEATLSPDPFACATVTAAPTAHCTLHTVAPGTLCPRLPVDLPYALGGQDCVYAVLPGQTLHYTVGLSSPMTTTPVSEIAACDALFHIIDKVDPVPAMDTIWLGLLADGLGLPFRMEITPVEGNDCPAPEQAFTCSF